MALVVSPRLDFLNKNPTHPITYKELDHELQHLRKREQLSSAVAIGSTVLAMIILGGVLGGGHILLGALCAIALVAALYSYCCRLADAALQSRYISPGSVSEDKPLLSFFSRNVEGSSK